MIFGAILVPFAVYSMTQLDISGIQGVIASILSLTILQIGILRLKYKIEVEMKAIEARFSEYLRFTLPKVAFYNLTFFFGSLVMIMVLWSRNDIRFLFIGGNGIFISIIALVLLKTNIFSISPKNLREIPESKYPFIWEVLRKSKLSVHMIGFLSLSRLKIVNAYQWGPNKKAVIMISDHLEKILNDGEIAAVFAHELGHIKHRHFEKIIITGLVSPLILLNFYCIYILFEIQEILGPITEILLLIMLGFLALGVPIIVLPWASRRWETEADIYAANLVSPETLVSALQKMVDHDMVVGSISKRAEFLLSHPHLDSRVKRVKSSDLRKDE